MSRALHERMDCSYGRNIFRPYMVALILIMLSTATVSAHSIDITTQLLDEANVSINALIEGEPMVDGQVILYAPSAPDTVWEQHIIDQNGDVQFAIDPSDTGEWAIQLRHSGHGEWVYVTVGDDGSITLAAPKNDRPAWQTWSLAAAVIAGLGGIALWSMRKPDDPMTR